MTNHEHAIEARATFIMLMLREDHRKLKALFELCDSTTMIKKREIMKETLAVLEVHANLKEELIYPAWREHVHEQGLDLMAEARETLHVVQVLIKALKHIDPEDERYEAMCTVLKEQVTHHIHEEEGKIFPLVEQIDLDWDRLTTDVIERHQRLEQKPLWLLGIPVIARAREAVSATRAVPSGLSQG